MYKGFLLVNKPSGPSSFAIIRELRQHTGVARIGHAGTLDPLASGLLLTAIDRVYTRQLSRFIVLDKRYIVHARLGQATTTYDSEGEITACATPPVAITESDIQAILPDFVGEQMQLPPLFSAKKYNGKRAYAYARANESITLDRVCVIIHSLVLQAFTPGPYPEVTLSVHCSKGTYVRSLIHDIGQVLNVGAHITGLHREAIGDYTDATAIRTLTPQSIRAGLFQ